MKSRVLPAVGWLLSLLLAFAAQPAAAQFYTQHNLVSDGVVAADLVDSSLVNAWGLASSGSSPWWVANNGTDTSTLYNASGPKIAKVGLTVDVAGAPTGLVFNSGTGFVVHNGAASGAAVFIFATESGSILGWNPGVPPPPPSTLANVAVPPSSAVYKGLAIAHTTSGDLLYATDFHHARVDVFDSSFAPVHVAGAFTDPNIPPGYAPFGIRNIGGTIYVTYALQDEDAHDDVPGMGHGFVDAYDTAGTFIRRVASRGTLNSPWGLALAPADFGTFSNALLIGNFGDGRIHAYDVGQARGNGAAKYRGMLHSDTGAPLEIEGLWALAFGNNAGAGPATTLFFTSGPDEEKHGLFGSLEPASPPRED